MSWFYLAALITAIICLGLIDYRHKLAVFHNAKRALTTISIAVALFVLWDIFGIWLGIFHHGGSAFALPYRLAPEFPIEEIFFLILLTYVTLISYQFFSRRSE